MKGCKSKNCKDTCYKYLGIYINLKLDFSRHYQIAEQRYRNVAHAIMLLQGVSTKQRITLLNAVAAAVLAYSMNVLIFPQRILQKLNTWTGKQLKIVAKASNKAST